MSLTIRDVMVKNVITINAKQSTRYAAKMMSANEIGCLVVLDVDVVVGIITEQDLIRRIIAENKDPEKTLVCEVMSTPPIVVEPSLNLEDAVEFMFIHKIKKLIVVSSEDKERQLVGLVTLTDIARIEHVLMLLLKNLFEDKGEVPPKRMEKVMHFYIV
jgi:CBS domain-containing protein